MSFKFLKHSLFLISLSFLGFLIWFFYNNSKGPDTCYKQNSDIVMSRNEAAKLAKDGCKEGILWPISYECNSFSGAWWIPLSVTGHKGCFPACVVNVETKAAEINWRCTGLLVK